MPKKWKHPLNARYFLVKPLLSLPRIPFHDANHNIEVDVCLLVTAIQLFTSDNNDRDLVNHVLKAEDTRCHLN